jgi:CubicO group peptidase (beta-lactamase class C family)
VFSVIVFSQNVGILSAGRKKEGLTREETVMRVDRLLGSNTLAGAALPVLVVLALCSGCGSAQVTDGDITSGVWAGSGGPENFYWELWQNGDGFDGVVHTVRDGRKETELPVDRVTWDAPELEMHMDITGVIYRGNVDFDKGRIHGRLFYGEKEGPEMELYLADPDRIPGLRARPADAPAYTYARPPVTDDGWRTADCEEVGLPHADVTGLVNAICAGDAGVVHSLLLVVGGQLVVEEYFHGYGRDDLHRLASVTKSVSSLLVGVAMDEGGISSVDASVLSFFPALEQPSDEHWRSQTLHHLLSMSMGLDWGPGGGPHGTGPEFFQGVLEREVVHEPGTHWAYHSANVNLLSGVIKKATGQHADVFAEEHLFDPLGITAYDWSFMARDGYCLMDGSLHLRPRDMAKLGLLLRDEGRWRGRRVVSADWIRQSATAQIATEGPEKYGYLWWLGEFPGREGTQPAVFANGHGSQFIAWLPERDLIFVVTGGNEDNGKHFAIAELIGRHL